MAAAGYTLRMKKAILLIVAALFISVQSIPADGLFEPYEGQHFSVGLSYLHFGWYMQSVIHDDGSRSPFYGGFHEAEISVEYRPWVVIGLVAYVDYKGYYWDPWDDGLGTIHPGYKDSTDAYTRLWGAQNFSAGAGLIAHLVPTLTPFDITASCAAEYVGWYEAEDDFYPGFGLSARINAVWKPFPWLGLAASGAFHYSYHPGKSDGIGTFELVEMNPGISCLVYF
jgi:hypothetical protein